MLTILAQTADAGYGWLAPWVQAGSAATIAMLFVWVLVWKGPKDEDKRQQEIERRDKREDAIREWHGELHEKTSDVFKTAVESICAKLENGQCKYKDRTS